jgi:putative SOS response-associated peptidase YedK
MCGRYVMISDEFYQNLISQVDDAEKQQKVKTGEIFPTNIVPVITCDDSGNKVHLYKWGFPSFKGSRVIINARSETIEEKPMFRKAFHTKRCLIPSQGFYEWKQGEESKKKFHIYLKDQPIMFMAGIYNTFKDKNENIYSAFIIITIAANETMSSIHQRMPVIIGQEDQEIWLRNDPDNMDDVRGLLKSYQKEMILQPA